MTEKTSKTPETRPEPAKGRRRITRLLTNLMTIALLALAIVTVAQTALRGDTEAAQQAWTMIEDGALVIDVRSPGEYASGHLEGALNIPYDQTEALMEAIGEDRSRPVVMYCGSGRRVGVAIEALEARGYDTLFNASGLDALEATRP